MNAYLREDKTTILPADVPLRLLDCLGFAMPLCFFSALADLVVAVDLRFRDGAEGCGGFGAGFRTGEERKTDGDGIVMVSIVRNSCVEASMMLAMGCRETMSCGWSEIWWWWWWWWWCVV